jgi:hypothetical protein
MAIEDLTALFETIKAGRRQDPLASLRDLGSLAEVALGLLVADCETYEIRTERIPGDKKYNVDYRRGRQELFSRPINSALFVRDPRQFRSSWSRALSVMAGEAGYGLTTVQPTTLDQLFYTAVMAYAATTDVFNAGNRGGPGTLLEIAVGATISLLTGLEERAGVALSIDGFDSPINVSVDMTFGDVEGLPLVAAEETFDDQVPGEAREDVRSAPTLVEEPTGEDSATPSRFGEEDAGPVLVVPTKLSTRERIVQAYAHQRILDEAKQGKYHTILCACNENNLTKPPREAKRLANVGVTDTLVPKTIVLYELYVAKLAGIYYLDPPPSYLRPTWPHFPHVATYGTLLTAELADLFRADRDRG